MDFCLDFLGSWLCTLSASELVLRISTRLLDGALLQHLDPYFWKKMRKSSSSQLWEDFYFPPLWWHGCSECFWISWNYFDTWSIFSDPAWPHAVYTNDARMNSRCKDTVQNYDDWSSDLWAYCKIDWSLIWVYQNKGGTYWFWQVQDYQILHDEITRGFDGICWGTRWFLWFWVWFGS